MYQIVTFDIFDTLLHRRLHAPVDVFEAVRVSAFERDEAILHHDLLAHFPRDRMRAEAEARRHQVALAGGEAEVTFEEIYETYQRLTGCSPEMRRILQAIELDKEAEVLFASKPGLARYRALATQAQQVAFISDMYLPASWLSARLETLGFEGAADQPIYVSAAYRKTKHSGALYDVVAQDLGVKPGPQWLHVGDNQAADIASAQAKGLATEHADWARVDNRRLAGGHAPQDYLVRSIVRFLDLPQAAQFRPEDPLERIGFQIFGPLVFGFTLWVAARAKASDLSRILFIARDGWLPCLLFEDLKGDMGLGHVAQSYVYFSRQVGFQFGSLDWDVAQVRSPLNGMSPKSLRSALATAGYDPESLGAELERFGLDLDETVTDANRDIAARMLATTYGRAMPRAVARRAEVASYFQEHLKPGERTGLVDIGWNGNIQKLLLGSLGPGFPKENVEGFYLGLHPAARLTGCLGHQMLGWLSHFGDQETVETWLKAGGVELLEFALTADHGTTLGFEVGEDREVAPVLEELNPEEAQYRETAMKVQAGIRRFVEQYRPLLHSYSPESLSSTAWAEPFARMVMAPSREEVAALAGLSHSDSPGTTRARLVLAERQPGKVRRSRRRLRKARGAAFWKAAFDVLNRR